MNENYLFIEGIKVPLTDEQVAMIKGTGALKSKEKSPFSRVEKNDPYWFIDIDGRITQTYESGVGSKDDEQFSCANYCSDKELIEERAIREELSRRLWRFSMENGGEEINWEDLVQSKWRIFIHFGQEAVECEVMQNVTAKSLNEVYFVSEEVALRAIKEVVKPFCEDSRISKVVFKRKG